MGAYSDCGCLNTYQACFDVHLRHPYGISIKGTRGWDHDFGNGLGFKAVPSTSRNGMDFEFGVLG